MNVIYIGHPRGQDSLSIKSLQDINDDNLSESSDVNSLHKRKTSLMEMRRNKTLKDLDALNGEQDASTMVVQMMEKKLKDKIQQYKIEKAKRQRFEERAQQLLIENEKYKIQLAELKARNIQLTKDNNTLNERNRLLQSQVEDDSNTIKNLKTQRDAMRNERDESFKILTKIEKDHQLKIKKLKDKHKMDMSKLSTGFLQSLGAEPGKDVRKYIKDLKQNNVELKEQVETLAETLARKERSLIEALQAVDQLVVDDEKYEQAQLVINQQQQILNNNNNKSKRPKNPLPAPPPNKKNKKDIKTYWNQAKPNATFF